MAKFLNILFQLFNYVTQKSNRVAHDLAKFGLSKIIVMNGPGPFLLGWIFWTLVCGMYLSFISFNDSYDLPKKKHKNTCKILLLTPRPLWWRVVIHRCPSKKISFLKMNIWRPLHKVENWIHMRHICATPLWYCKKAI